jgi:hypothetical protein
MKHTIDNLDTIVKSEIEEVIGTRVKDEKAAIIFFLRSEIDQLENEIYHRVPSFCYQVTISRMRLMIDMLEGCSSY